jgi:hypothetical protein
MSKPASSPRELSRPSSPAAIPPSLICREVIKPKYALRNAALPTIIVGLDVKQRLAGYLETGSDRSLRPSDPPIRFIDVTLHDDAETLPHSVIARYANVVQLKLGGMLLPFNNSMFWLSIAIETYELVTRRISVPGLLSLGIVPVVDPVQCKNRNFMEVLNRFHDEIFAINSDIMLEQCEQLKQVSTNTSEQATKMVTDVTKLITNLTATHEVIRDKVVEFSPTYEPIDPTNKAGEANYYHARKYYNEFNEEVNSDMHQLHKLMSNITEATEHLRLALAALREGLIMTQEDFGHRPVYTPL